MPDDSTGRDIVRGSRGSTMDEEIKPAAYRKRKFQSIHELLNSKKFSEPIDPHAASGEIAVVSVPDMNRTAFPNVRPSAAESIDGTPSIAVGSADIDVGNDGAVGQPASMRQPVADLNDVPDDWLIEQEKSDGYRRKPDGCVTDICRSLSDIEPVVSQIMSGSLREGTTVLMFASTDRYSESERLATSIAVSLSNRATRQVMLVDSDFEKRYLTRVYGLELDPGISNYLFQSPPSSNWLYKTDRQRVDFVPAGDFPFRSVATETSNMTRWLQGLKKDYSFICVNAGDAHGASIPLWSQHCGGAYLSVNKQQSSQAIACSAVARLRRLETRLLGCVVN